MPGRFFVRGAGVAGYHPANHTGTTNRRLIGAETVGAKGVEIVVGTIAKGQGAASRRSGAARGGRSR